jgi:hypothetical protein
MRSKLGICSGTVGWSFWLPRPAIGHGRAAQDRLERYIGGVRDRRERANPLQIDLEMPDFIGFSNLTVT